MNASTCRCGRCQRCNAAFEVLPFPPHAPFSEAEEFELAMELLAVSNEAELEQFLGNMFKSVWKGIKKVGSAVGKVAAPLGGALKALAKKALPFVGGALGSFIPIPGVGTALGSALGGALGNALELEFGGLVGEQQELAMARRFVRIAGAAAQHAAAAQADASPQAVVRAALTEALRSHTPPAPVLFGRRARQAAR